MRLSTKLLTILPSVAVVGAAVPTIASCSCSKDQYLFNCGDHINCRDKDDSDYHKPEEVKAAAKIRAAKADKRDDINISINADIQELPDRGEHFYFYDLVATILFMQNDTINLKNWKVEVKELGPQTFVNVYSFNLNGINYPENPDDSNFAYAQNSDDPTDRSIYLSFGGIATKGIKIKSYVFSDCQWAE